MKKFKSIMIFCKVLNYIYYRLMIMKLIAFFIFTLHNYYQYNQMNDWYIKEEQMPHKSSSALALIISFIWWYNASILFSVLLSKLFCLFLVFTYYFNAECVMVLSSFSTRSLLPLYRKWREKDEWKELFCKRKNACCYTVEHVIGYV